jgi:hypothetical protein
MRLLEYHDHDLRDNFSETSILPILSYRKMSLALIPSMAISGYFHK